MLRILALPTILTALLVALAVQPFLPGGHDAFAVPLSVMARLAAMAGLVLVPIGATWLVYEYRHRRASHGDERLRTGSRRFATAALVAGSLVCVIVALGAAAFAGLSAGVAALGLFAYLIARAGSRIRRLRSSAAPHLPVVAACLAVVPVVATALQIIVLRPASELSRERAIRNSAALIAELERYRERHGRYPPSLLSVNEDYRPLVRGIERYLYEPAGEAHNLAFEQLALALDTREFVVYNPLDDAVFTSHNRDLLEFSGNELSVRRGFYAMRSLPHPGWRSFLFD